MSEEYTRKLAHVERIVNIRPISGADQIEVAQVLGWECVIAKKDNFKVGDLVVYIEVDSIVPEKPEFEFLRERKFRVRTIKLRKQVSQGLVLPLTILPPITACNPYSWEHWKKPNCEGLDVTQILGIKHYDPESSLNQTYQPDPKIHNHPIVKFILKFSLGRKILLPFLRKPKGAWPGYWLEKTDECRIQSNPAFIERYKDKPFYVTEKLDGTSTTFFQRKIKFGYIYKKYFGVCSRNIFLKTEDESYYWKMARKYDIRNILKKDGRELIIQGETIGEGIQKNKYGIKGLDFYVFNIIDSRLNKHFNLEEMEEFCQKNQLKMVPVIERNISLKSSVNEIIQFSIGKSKLNNKTEREGLVFRNIENGNKISFKAISPNFLLKYDE